MTTQSTSLRLADQLSGRAPRQPYGYPMYAVTSDGGVICPECAFTEREAIATTTGSDGWCVVAIAVNQKWIAAELMFDSVWEAIVV